MSETRVGEVEHYFGRIHVATVRVEQPIHVGDWLRIQGVHDNLEVQVKSMEMDHKPIDRAAPGQVVGIKVPTKAHAGSAVLEGTKPSFWARLLNWS